MGDAPQDLLVFQASLQSLVKSEKTVRNQRAADGHAVDLTLFAVLQHRVLEHAPGAAVLIDDTRDRLRKGDPVRVAGAAGERSRCSWATVRQVRAAGPSRSLAAARLRCRHRSSGRGESVHRLRYDVMTWQDETKISLSKRGAGGSAS